MTKITITLAAALILFTSWTKLSSEETTCTKAEPVKYLNEVSPLLVQGKVKVTPLEKKDIIVLNDNKKVTNCKSEVRIVEIKYLDGKGKMPVRIVSIKRHE